MKFLPVLALALMQAAPQEPAVDPSRVVLETSRGRLVLALYPEVAPRHVKHFLDLVRAKYYDGTRFGYVRKGFVVQHAGDADRLRPFTREQDALRYVKLPAELSRLHHVRGAVSMARQPDDLDSATTSFSLLLGDASHMDGKYTIFGRVERGLQTLDALGETEVRPDGTPALPLNLHRAYVENENRERPLVWGGLFIVLGLGAFLLSGRALPRYAGPVGLSFVVAGFFIAFVAATPRVLEVKDKESRSLMGLVVFLSLLALFKLMGRYEKPRA